MRIVEIYHRAFKSIRLCYSKCSQFNATRKMSRVDISRCTRALVILKIFNKLHLTQHMDD